MSELSQPEIADAILQRYERYRIIASDLTNVSSSKDIEHVYSLPPQYVLEMAKEAVITSPIHFASHRPFGKWVVLAKKLLYKFARPFMKICLTHQQNFNDLNLSLAHAVIALEARVKYLETLQQKNVMRDN